MKSKENVMNIYYIYSINEWFSRWWYASGHSRFHLRESHNDTAKYLTWIWSIWLELGGYWLVLCWVGCPLSMSNQQEIDDWQTINLPPPAFWVQRYTLKHGKSIIVHEESNQVKYWKHITNRPTTTEQPYSVGQMAQIYLSRLRIIRLTNNVWSWSLPNGP